MISRFTPRDFEDGAGGGGGGTATLEGFDDGGAGGGAEGFDLTAGFALVREADEATVADFLWHADGAEWVFSLGAVSVFF